MKFVSFQFTTAKLGTRTYIPFNFVNSYYKVYSFDFEALKNQPNHLATCMQVWREEINFRKFTKPSIPEKFITRIYVCTYCTYFRKTDQNPKITKLFLLKSIHVLQKYVFFAKQ